MLGPRAVARSLPPKLFALGHTITPVLDPRRRCSSVGSLGSVPQGYPATPILTPRSGAPATPHTPPIPPLQQALQCQELLAHTTDGIAPVAAATAEEGDGDVAALEDNMISI